MRQSPRHTAPVQGRRLYSHGYRDRVVFLPAISDGRFRSCEMASNLTINPQRLWDQIMETAQFGATPKGGIKRLTLSDDDKKVRDWFKRECEALGCEVTIDAVGNMFALRAGRNNQLLPV